MSNREVGELDLREFYNENRLATGDLSVAGARLNMRNVKLPVFEL
ncbi:MAG TPA: hypothetical protein VNR88_01655 [Hyphomicrobium sp.]|nr:hypothetical protein [Hyphomicrobium sp.]